MSEYAEVHRKAMREKAHRLAHADPHEKVDASSWTPPEPLNTEAKTGLRPISQRQYKKGGKVHGEAANHHAGRKPRKSGGRAFADAMVNRDVREANEERPGIKHVGGFKNGGKTRRGRGLGGPLPPLGLAELGINALIGDKDKDKPDGKKRGGRAHRDTGGPLAPPISAGIGGQGRMAFQGGPSAMSKIAGLPSLKTGGKAKHGKPCRTGRKSGGMSVSDGEIEGTRPTGGREAHAKGGKAGKGKMNVNIVIATNPGHESAAPMGGPPPQPPIRPPGMPVAVPPPAGPPPGMPVGAPPPMGAGPPMPPMMPRKRGGKVKEHAGSGSGLGRLEKLRDYGHEARELDGHY